MAMPGRAQQAAGGRFAFADTTLLRDTLGLSFEGLFPLADSLKISPDTLRALSIRYRYSLAQMVRLSDSLGVEVDSVGPVMRRERFNPLAAGRRRTNTFTYTSGYTIDQNATTWNNNVDYNFVSGPLFLRNNTSVLTNRYKAGVYTRVQQTRSSSTEAGWTFSRDFSLGGRAILDGYDNRTPGAFGSENETKGDYQISMRSRHQPARGLTSELNLFSGVVNLSNLSQQKRGLSGDLNGRLRYVRGGWLTNEANGQLTGNLARTRIPGASDYTRTEDLSGNLRGTLGLYTGAPVGFNLNYNLRDSRVETPASVPSYLTGRDSIQQVLSGDQGIDMSLRVRRDNDRYLNFGQRFGYARQASATAVTSQNSRRDRGFSMTGRYGFHSISLDGDFGRTLTTNEYPQRGGTSGGYGEHVDGRSVEGSLEWALTPRVSAKLNGRVNLSQSRYFTIGTYLNPPVPRDQYDQSYRAEGRYTFSQRFNTALGLEVSRSLYVNIPAASTAANNEIRSYRADWRWTYHLLPGLTATQRNQMVADYLHYTFLPTSADRLSLDYHTYTELNADITPRFHVDVTHDIRYQPTGGYAPLDPPLNDGSTYFSQTDDSRTTTLRATMTYTPAPVISLTIRPEYTTIDRKAISEGVATPQRASRTLNFSGGAHLNLPVGRRGQLTGGFDRTFRSDAITTYTSGAPSTAPTAEYDYWTGNLQLSWSL